MHNKYLTSAFIRWQIGQALSFSDIIDADFRFGVQSYGDNIGVLTFVDSTTRAALATRWFKIVTVQGLSQIKG